jgi:hypothetical protein
MFYGFLSLYTMIFCKKFGEELDFYYICIHKKYFLIMTARDDREREKSIRETIGKFFFDLAKTTFTAMVIGGSVALITGMEEALPYAILLGVGVISTVLLAVIGYYILKHK